jgi:cytochrome bd ubiquinol oxidase subunit II
METFWFIALVFMMIMYVILDGFDLGCGIFYLSAAKTDNERRIILNSIGPVWDGNEVWLVAAGGTLFFSFPVMYASSFSGFYLPLMIVLWLLIGRAIGIELRKHIDNVLWKKFWDAVFAISSTMLVIFFGAALGNIIRGVPLQKDGTFFEALWTTFTVSPDAGIIDWFTILMSLVAFSVLRGQAANFIAVKTEGIIQDRARKISRSANYYNLMLSIIMFIAVSVVRPEMWDNYFKHYWGFIFPGAGIAGLAGMVLFRLKQNDVKAFISSSVFIAGMLAGTAFGLYPNLLPSTINNDYSLTVYNSKAADYGLQIALYWWIAGIILTTGYFIYLFYMFKGKVSELSKDEGY